MVLGSNEEINVFDISLNSKELGVLILTVEHNYITVFASVITRRVTTTTCFGPICGPSSGCD